MESGEFLQVDGLCRLRPQSPLPKDSSYCGGKASGLIMLASGCNTKEIFFIVDRKSFKDS